MQKHSGSIRLLVVLAVLGALISSGISYGSQVQNNLSANMTMRAATHKHNIDEDQLLLNTGIGALIGGGIGGLLWLRSFVQNASVITNTKSELSGKQCRSCNAPVKQGWKKCPFCGAELG